MKTARRVTGERSKVRLAVLGTGTMAANQRGCSRPMPASMWWPPPMSIRPAPRLSRRSMESPNPSAALMSCWPGASSMPITNVTPDAVHHPTTMKIIAAGKHVLCEKPLAENFALADEMARAAEKAAHHQHGEPELPQRGGACRRLGA